MTETSPSTVSSPAARLSRWPVLCSLQGYRPAFVTRDLVTGLTLVAIAIPEQLATSRLCGFLSPICFLAFFAGGLALLAPAGSPDYVALAGALALMVGIVLVIGGIFRLGWIADLLSVPVTVGFLAGISVHIILSQLPAILRPP